MYLRPDGAITWESILQRWLTEEGIRILLDAVAGGSGPFGSALRDVRRGLEAEVVGKAQQTGYFVLADGLYGGSHPRLSATFRVSSLAGEGEVTTDQLVRQTLRMSPDRVIIGEVRGREALSMVMAMPISPPSDTCYECGGQAEATSQQPVDAPEITSPALPDVPGKLLYRRCESCLESLYPLELCGACGGPLWALGALGRSQWLRCRNCGMDWSRPAREDE